MEVPWLLCPKVSNYLRYLELYITCMDIAEIKYVFVCVCVYL
jgi:hypothetical protein